MLTTITARSNSRNNALVRKFKKGLFGSLDCERVPLRYLSPTTTIRITPATEPTSASAKNRPLMSDCHHPWVDETPVTVIVPGTSYSLDETS